jgi:hypothetical protein
MKGGVEISDLILRLFLDLSCIGLLALLVGQRRPRRGLFVIFTTFNVALFCVLTIITERHIGPAVGFGLFALLSIVRLRSEPFSNQELSYFFSALALALINGVRIQDRWVSVLLDVTVLLTLFLVDHPSIHRRTARTQITLESVLTEPIALRAEVERRLGVEVVELTVVEIDYVRESMRLNVRSNQPPGVAEPSGGMDAATGAGR